MSIEKHETDDRYTSFEPKNVLVFTSLVDGKIDLSVYLSNETDDDAELIEAMTAWVDDTKAVIIAPHFTLAGPVDGLIDLHEMPALDFNIDLDAKPIFDALKAEMLEQIKRIDSLIFKDVSPCKNQSNKATAPT